MAQLCMDETSLFDDTTDHAAGRGAVLARIMELNPTATEAYLQTFTDRSLGIYLDHLESMGAGRGSVWERPGDSPAIIERESLD